VQPLTDTRYHILANLGKCTAEDSMFVHVAPYPAAVATGDTTICFGDEAQLHGAYIGTYYSWSPASSLRNAATPNPSASPVSNTAYIFVVTDTLGCPKPVSDTVFVNVIPHVSVNAGNDTAIVAGQPLQLNVSTNIDLLLPSYSWLPVTGLDDPNIQNPVATLSAFVDTITYLVTVAEEHGCKGENDITVVVFKTQPDIFVPSAFTPNADGHNDLLKAIPVGIAKFDYFGIYNRFGQPVFMTQTPEAGWNGIFKDRAQPSGAYIYQTQGVDFTGKTVFKKGTVVLIR
jgi:gliding motility-associated-like protein